ncbi:MAG: GntR family transcriptional regulator [Sedimentisphaerales bacterium]|nr:GntR family transcriptional regulator [Sedimentisphaerales bacterium]
MNMKATNNNDRTGHDIGVAELQPRLSKYQVIARNLVDQISNGALSPGERLESENELAVQYGVSRITARQALAVLEKEGYVKRKRGKGTYVSSSIGKTKADSSGKMRQVTFVVADYSLTDYYTLAEIAAAERWLVDKGIAFSLSIVTVDDIIAGELPPVVKNNLCDGLIFDLIECNLYMPMFLQTNIPMIALGNHRISPCFSYVRCSVEKMIHQAWKTLLSRYSQPVAFIGGPPDFELSQEAMISYLMSSKRAGQRPLMELFVGDAEFSEVYNSEWHNAYQEVVSIADRADGPFSMITTAATVQSVVEAYKKLGFSLAEYPILTVGVPQDMSAEDCAQLYISTVDPAAAIELALTKLLELKKAPDTVIQAGMDMTILAPGEFDYERLLKWKVNNPRIAGMIRANQAG